MSKKKTTAEFIKEVELMHGKDYSVLSEYVGARTNVKMKHNTCGNEFNVMPTNFLKGTKCPNCYGSKKRTTEEFKKEVYNLVGVEYKVIGDYLNNKTPIMMIHVTCGHEYKVSPLAFLRQNTRCPKCSAIEGGIKQRKTLEKFRDEVRELVSNEYEVIGEYKNTDTKIKMQHNTCGNIYDVTPNNFLKGKRCPKCAIKTGVLANNYRSYLTKEQRERKRLSLEHSLHIWKKQILKRDDYKCVLCKNDKESLHVHHLDGYHWCKEKRYDVNNGVTLCKTCHNQFHGIYTSKNNTKEQFEEFASKSLI